MTSPAARPAAPRLIATVVWELPQSLLGALLLAASHATGGHDEVGWDQGRLFVRTRGLGVSLGLFVFWFDAGNRYFRPDRLMRRHEHGHTFQSRLLGPLYLPLVGAPSTLRVAYALLYRELTGRRWKGYFDGYPESWADRLGGITRAERAASITEED